MKLLETSVLSKVVGAIGKAGASAAESSGLTIVLKVVLPAVVGILGALLIIALDVPKTLRELVLRLGTAATLSLAFGPAVVRALDHYVDWYQAVHATGLDYVQMVAPIFLLVGGASWFALNAAVVALRVLRDRGGYAAGRRMSRWLGGGQDDDPPPPTDPLERRDMP